MKLYLLTHERELLRKTNTGKCVLQAVPEYCERILWQRKEPNTELLRLIEQNNIGLVYPSKETNLTTQSNVYNQFIILDATWQEAQKMYNQSPYLHNLPKLSLQPDVASRFTLRRNQKPNGLCTAEVAMLIFKQSGLDEKAQEIERVFDLFLSNTVQSN